MNATAARRKSLSARASGSAVRAVMLPAFLGAMLATAAYADAPPAASPATPMSAPMMAPTMSPMKSATELPSSVLLFPALVGGDGGAAMPAASVPVNLREAQHIVTEMLRTSLERANVGVVVYSGRLPSMQRAVSEGIKPEDAKAGPGDDARKAQRFANVVGANEYLTCSIDDYKYDPAMRSVNFNLSIFRYAADGTVLGTTAIKAIGTAPADISGAHQESFADESAAQVAGQQAIEGVYPQVAAILSPPKMIAKKKKDHKIGKYLIPVIAVGAAIIGPRT